MKGKHIARGAAVYELRAASSGAQITVYVWPWPHPRLIDLPMLTCGMARLGCAHGVGGKAAGFSPCRVCLAENMGMARHGEARTRLLKRRKRPLLLI